MKQKTDVRPGALALMVLKTLRAGTAARIRYWRIEQISGDLLAVNQGTLYPVLLKLGKEGAILRSGHSEQPRGAPPAHAVRT